MRDLLVWLGVHDDLINKLTFAVMRLNDGVEVQEKLLQIPTFTKTSLPDDAVHLNSYTGNVNQHLERVLHYMKSRNLYLEDEDFYWSPAPAYRERLIIPFKFKNEIVGWTSRHVGKAIPKYLTESQPGYVFNMDRQTNNKEFVIVTEGALDALPIGGVGILGNEISQQQAQLINGLHKDVILVPDRDRSGKKLIETVIEEYGWSVSLPDWGSGVKDAGDAVNRYGKLYTLYSIVEAAERSPLKIRLKAKRW
jgi:hypothetical protein